MKPTVTRADIVAGLRRVGLRRGDRVNIHSSLSSFGMVEGGAQTVILALLEILGPEGTLMMPTFSQGKVEVWDRDTPSFNGRITETFRIMPGVKRSRHPTHAYAAIGPDADRYLADADKYLAWGPESPLGRLIADGGWVMLLGCGHGSSTAQHHGETAGHVKCFGLDTTGMYYIDEEGELTAAVAPTWRSGVCPYNARKQERQLRYLRAVRDTYVGGAHIQLMRGNEVIKAILRLVRGETGEDHCPTCTQHPDVLMFERHRARHPDEKPSKGDPWR
ncbi:MAG: AAC(3) family N-acetyltransferase [Planctomycetota bacterium]|jgi:aminoglycoside N3'-acetyltransferase